MWTIATPKKALWPSSVTVMSKPKQKPSKVTGTHPSSVMNRTSEGTTPHQPAVRLRAVPGKSVALMLAASIALAPSSGRAGFASQGQGIQVVASGTVANGALFLETRSTWINTAIPEKPYVVDTWFALPNCDDIPVSRLVTTIWGGTANYTCNLNVEVNGAVVPLAAPLTFGTTNDANATFSASVPSVYGAGFGVWVVGIPLPRDLLHKDGSSNHVQLTVTTPDTFDGRINHVTLLAVHQSAALNNSFDYAISEGSGDIYRTPTAPQVDARTVALGPIPSGNASSARLQVLYTYGDIGQNDRLYFNGVQLGGDDVSGWDKVGTGLDFGPNLLSFDVLGNLATTNAVKFSVAATDVPGTRETSLRPQLAALAVTRPAAPPALGIALNVTITWPVSADTYQLQFRPDLEGAPWTDVTNTPVVIDGLNTVLLPRTSAQQFYQLKKLN